MLPMYALTKYADQGSTLIVFHIIASPVKPGLFSITMDAHKEHPNSADSVS